MKVYPYTWVFAVLTLTVCFQSFSVSEGAKVLTCFQCANCTPPFKAGEVETKTCPEHKEFCYKLVSVTNDGVTTNRGCTEQSEQCPPIEGSLGQSKCFTCQKDHCNTSTSQHRQYAFILLASTAVALLQGALRRQA